MYRAEDLDTKDVVAVKMELVKCPVQYLAREAEIYDKLGTETGFPRKIWYGTEAGCRVLVMDILAFDVQTSF